MPPPDDRTIIPGVPATSSREDTVMIASQPHGAGHEEGASSQTTDEALALGTRLGEFEITGLIGVGGFGIVYLALDHFLERKVAVKEYMPAELARRSGDHDVVVRSKRHTETFAAGMRSFINEAQMLAKFDHPSLLKVYRFWQANGTAYVAMPFYEGVTLKQALRDLAERPEEVWLKDLLRNLLDALEVIHDSHCYHRDIAPDNILILRDGTPLLLDFGAARRVIGDMTQALTVILKPGYAPIEQYAEVPNMKQGPWTDLYALASVVYYAIMGQPPAPAVARVMTDPLVPLTQAAAGKYSHTFLHAIDSALAVKPENRPQSIAEFRALLRLDASGTEAARSISAASEHGTGSKPPISHVAKLPVVPVTHGSLGASQRQKLTVIASAILAISLLAGVLAWRINEPLDGDITATADAPTQHANVLAPPLVSVADVKATLANFECAYLDSSVAGSIVAVRGHVSSDADAVRVASLVATMPGVKRVNTDLLRVYPHPYCTVASALAPYAQFDVGAPTVAIRGGRNSLHVGEKLIADVEGADFAGFVYVDLYDTEGNVVHILPNAKERKNRLEPRQQLVLGEDPVSGMQWDVVPPTGKHMLVVMVSRSRLFPRARKGDIENGTKYAAELREALKTRSSEEHLAAYYTLFDVLPKR